MSAYVQAGVDIYESTLRYAEVERDGSEYRLLKLGSCEFDFNMAEALLSGAHPMFLDTLAEALNDVFSETQASDLHIVFHPPNCYSFFTPMDVGMTEQERKQRLQDEASILTSGDKLLPLHLTADILHTETLDNGKVVEWFHVLGLEEQVHDKLSRILGALPHSSYRFNLSTSGTANAIERIARKENIECPEEAPYSLAIGYYRTHTEYVLCRCFRWHFSHHAMSNSPADSVYFALALLRKLDLKPAQIGQLYTYGEEIDAEIFAMLQNVFGRSAEVLNPLDVVALDRKRPGVHFMAESYVPCIGIAM